VKERKGVDIVLEMAADRTLGQDIKLLRRNGRLGAAFFLFLFSLFALAPCTPN
jgi:hypothetical protein